MTAADPPRIFVQIPSYRDRECQWTVRDLFARARHPERVSVGICWQFDPVQDQACFVTEDWPAAQVRRVDFHASEARGLGWARQQAQSLWHGEEYTLQIDSHMRFVPGWDALLLEELQACPSPWPVLTLYPAAYWPPDRLEDGMDPAGAVQVVHDFRAGVMLRYTVKFYPPGAPEHLPKPATGVAGGFLFGASRIIADVPSDPEIYFEGEEPNLAVRLFCHGFDLFSPHRRLIYHYYRRTDSRRPWDDANASRPNEASLARMRRLLEPAPGDTDALGRYGLGNVRTLEDYQIFAGVDLRGRTIASYARIYPFFYTSEVAETLVRTAGLAPAEGAVLFLLGNEGFLFFAGAKAFRRLTPLAAYIWCAIESGAALDAIVAGAAERLKVAESAVRDRVLAQICHWQGAGLLAGFAPPDESAADPPKRWAPRQPATVPDVFDVRILGQRLLVRCHGSAEHRAAAAILTYLPHTADTVEPATQQHCIELFHVGHLHYVVTDDAWPPQTADHPDWIGCLLLRAIAQSIEADRDTLLLVDGGILRDGADNVLLVGTHPAVARTIAGGRPQDDADGPAERAIRQLPALLQGSRVQLRRGDGMIRAVPAPAVLAETAFQQLRDAARLPDSIMSFIGLGEEPGRVLPFGRPLQPGAADIARGIVVEPGDGAAEQLVPAEPADGLVAMLSHACERPGIATFEDAALLVDWVERRPWFRLKIPSGDLAASRSANTLQSGT